MSSPAQPTASPPAPEVAPILFAAGNPPAANAGTGGRAAAAAGVVPFLPAVALLVLWLLWIPASGAYYAAAWYPSGLAVISLLALTMALRRRIAPAAAAARWALGSFGALVAINYLSIAWSRSPGDAL